MASGPYDIGDKVRVTGTFQDVNGGLIDPDAVVIKFRDPTGTVTTPSVTHDSLGTYHADQSITITGTWRYRVESTGVGQAAGEGSFQVNTSYF